MAKDFFRDIGTSIFKPVGDFISGGVTALQPGRVQQMQLERKRIESILQTEAGQRLLRDSQILMNEARTSSLDRGEGLYGGRGVDPYLDYFDKKAKLSKSKATLVEPLLEGEKLPAETIEFYNLANRRLDEKLSEYIAPKETQKGVDPIDQAIKVAGGRKTLPKTKKGKKDYRSFFDFGGEHEVYEDLGAPKRRDMRLEGQLPSWQLGDYFQSPTETVPEGNIPKTYPQMGIESIDDQATLEEMQKALPDIDIREEYESDPEGMQKLIELWRQGKLNKQNLHKAFSKIQEKAHQALGLA